MATVTQKQIRELTEQLEKTENKKLKEAIQKKLDVLANGLTVNK